MSASNVQKPKALIVDPGGTSRTMLRRLVEQAGLEAMMATSGAEALALARTEVVDIGLLCYLLPDMNGLQLAQSIRPHVAKGAQLLLVTLEDHQELVQEAFRAGITDVFQRARLGDLLAYLEAFFLSRDVKGAHILLVEDSRLFIHIVTDMLARSGMTVDCAASVKEACRRELFRIGVNDYVIKPVMEEELLVQARNLIIATGLAARVEAPSGRA